MSTWWANFKNGCEWGQIDFHWGLKDKVVDG